ncbi:MAG: hypothetical protein QFB86_00020 [Patescibacteria group bacterium]|nr:hypothetical protein [Patescibacteria group bacterium]
MDRIGNVIYPENEQEELVVPKEGIVIDDFDERPFIEQLMSEEAAIRELSAESTEPLTEDTQNAMAASLSLIEQHKAMMRDIVELVQPYRTDVLDIRLQEYLEDPNSNA